MKKMLILAALVCGLGYIGCSDSDVSDPAAQSDAGNVSFSVNKTTAPDEVAEVIAYLTRKGHDTLSAKVNLKTSSSGDISFSKVPSGIWHIKISAVDSKGDVLYTNEGDVTVYEGKTSKVQLTLLPATETGSGEIEIEVDWGKYKSVAMQPGPEDGKDAVIYYAQTYENFGDDPNMPIFSAMVNKEYNSSIALVDFDLSVVPDGAKIYKAVLYLYYNPSALPGGGSVHKAKNDLIVQRIIGPWEEDEVNYNMQPVFTWVDTVRVPKSKSGTQDYAIDVTKLVNADLKSPETSYGYMIRLANENLWNDGPMALFYTSDYSAAAKRPKLVIFYE
ncbi:MAG TPA: DNRLRE domain-containing protein [Ignavibacteriales bacterium]|nr:DNRLRE domain-containing protein [Ignavibacteriales bacterium]